MNSLVKSTGTLKGAGGLPETEQFSADFPLSTVPGKDTIVRVPSFDVWADEHGYYSLNCEPASLLTARNNLRARINYTAASPAWTSLGNEPFSIDVNIHGKSYKVRRAADAFSVKADRLPSVVKQFATTKHVRIKNLLKSFDLRKLPPIMQMRVESLAREGDRFLRALDWQTEELNREYRAIHEQLKKMVDDKMIEDGNGGIAQMLGEEAADDDEYNVRNESDYLVSLIRKAGPMPEGTDLLDFCVTNSQYELNDDGGFTDDMIVELIEAVRAKLAG